VLAVEPKEVENCYSNYRIHGRLLEDQVEFDPSMLTTMLLSVSDIFGILLGPKQIWPTILMQLCGTETQIASVWRLNFMVHTAISLGELNLVKKIKLKFFQ